MKIIPFVVIVLILSSCSAGKYYFDKRVNYGINTNEETAPIGNNIKLIEPSEYIELASQGDDEEIITTKELVINTESHLGTKQSQKQNDLEIPSEQKTLVDSPGVYVNGQERSLEDIYISQLPNTDELVLAEEDEKPKNDWKFMLLIIGILLTCILIIAIVFIFGISGTFAGILVLVSLLIICFFLGIDPDLNYNNNWND